MVRVKWPNDKIIKHKTGPLNLAEELGNVLKACQVMGMSRDVSAQVRRPLASFTQAIS